MAQMPPDQEAEYKTAFAFFDKDNTGSLTMKEFNMLMRSLGEELTDQQLNSFGGGGNVSYNAFFQYWADKWAKAQSGEDVLEAFRFWDRNRNGTVDANEMKAVLTRFGEQLTPQEAEEFVRLGGGATIRYNEYVEKMKESSF